LFSILGESKTREHLLSQYFLKFDETVDCVPHKEGFMVNRYTLSMPIDAIFIKINKDSLEGKFELEATGWHMFYN
jgi:hypothetical protein